MISGDLKSRMPEFIRAINFQILQLARPESVFNLRSRLPTEYKQEYFRQEHFSFANIVRHVMSLPWDGARSFMKLTAFTRTNTAIQELLRTSKHHDALATLFQTDKVLSFLPGQRLSLPEVSFICIICSEAFGDCSQVWVAIQDFLTECSEPKVTGGTGKESAKALLVIFNMSVHSSPFVSFLRRKIDEGMEHLKAKVPSNYRMPSVILLLHIPPELLKARASYNALATNSWISVYTDTFGIEQSDLEDGKVSSEIDPRRWLQVAFGLTKQPAVDTVRSELGDTIFQSIREALRKITFFQMTLKPDSGNGVQKSLPAYKEQNSVKAADWICNEVLMKRPYLKMALLDNYASYWGSLLEETAVLICSQISSGQTVSISL